MIKKIFYNSLLNKKPTHSVAAAALIISLAGIASRILGLVRDRILAAQFGAGDTLDAYYAAFRVPDLIYNLMIVGALSAAFIPVFTELVAKKKEENAWKLSSGVLSLQIIVTAAVSLIMVLFAPQIMKVVTPGFSGEKMDLTVSMTRIMFLSTFLLGISGIFGGILVSFKKFLIYSLAPIFYNIGIIIGALFFVKAFGVIGLAWGVVLGAFLHMMVQYPSLKHSGFNFKLLTKEAIRNKDVIKVLQLMVPRTLSIAVSQINFTVITIFASTLTAGSLAVFNFANNIQSAPLGLFGISFAIAVFPTLSAYAATGKNEEFIRSFSRVIRQILFFVIPASVVLFLLRAQIVRVVLGSGKFDWSDTILTFRTLGYLSLSLFAQSLIPLLTRSFYAIQNTKIPLYVALVSEGVNILLAFLLIGKLQVIGLAVAFSVSSFLNMFLLLYFLRREIGSLDGRNILAATWKICVASALSGVAVQAVKIFIGTRGELDTFVAIMTQLVVALAMGVGVFALACHWLKIEEFFTFMHSITRKVLKAKKTIQENIGEVSGV